MNETILNEIINDLSDNFNNKDNKILKDILNDMIANALFISKRRKTDNNLLLLKSEIKKAVKTIYLRRGTEDVDSLSESGKNSIYTDALKELRENIIKNGKRVIF